MTADLARPDSCILILVGAGGDLAKRMLYPALFNLAQQNLLPKKFALLGIARESVSTEEFQKRIHQDLKEHLGAAIYDVSFAKQITEHAEYLSADSSLVESYPAIAEKIQEIKSKEDLPSNLLFYLATPPSLFNSIPQFLSENGLLNQDDGTWKRVVFEKPFGRDLATARALNLELAHFMKEDQIYRIDHYLGKETVQNIMVLRFANGILEPVWNHNYIDSVQITVAETLGVEDRGSYYDTAGALRDMVPNHLFQLVSLIGMEPPNSFEADDVRSEKVKVLNAIKRFSEEDVLHYSSRGQYGPGLCLGKKVVGYREEKKVSPNSETETFTAMKLEIDNWRWAGVPFYLRTGKRMVRRETEVTIVFKCAPFQMFQHTGEGCALPNILSLQIQPKEQIVLNLAGKIPGPGVHLGTAPLQFNYVEAFGGTPQTGYETLLFDCMKGDATLFQRGDQIEAAWEVVNPILDVWKALPARDLPNYAAGTWGPKTAHDLLAREGRRWLLTGSEKVESTSLQEGFPKVGLHTNRARKKKIA